MHGRSYRFMALYLAGALWVLGSLPGEALAAFIPSSNITSTQTTDPALAQRMLASPQVKQRLEALGLSEAELRARLAQLPPEQAQQVAQHLQILEAGRGEGTLILVLLLILALITYLYITGKRIVIE